jgi:hypothetical protein
MPADPPRLAHRPIGISVMVGGRGRHGVRPSVDIGRPCQLALQDCWGFGNLTNMVNVESA